MTLSYIKQSAPNLSCVIKVPAWRHPPANIGSQSKRHLLATRNVMFCMLMYSASQSNQIHLKLGQESLKTLMMLPCEDVRFRRMAAWRISMTRHYKRNCCNSTPDGQIFFKFLTFDERPGLKTSPGPFWIILIAPPSGNRKLQSQYFGVLCLAG